MKVCEKSAKFDGNVKKHQISKRFKIFKIWKNKTTFAEMITRITTIFSIFQNVSNIQKIKMGKTTVFNFDENIRNKTAKF